MKKIVSLLTLALSLVACAQPNETEFKKEALENVMLTTSNDKITFQEILKKYEGQTIVLMFGLLGVQIVLKECQK
jgi:hypothetical protein